MCILCVASKWLRRVVTMLPWLVIPFIIIWAFSQLLPPGYRLEVTSTRLACLGVLLSSLGWYELLMPWLSTWRARRSAILRERELIEAQEAAKWKKEATRQCRNCLTPYKVQSPAGGRFTCTVCGHVSKRPVLEVPFMASQAGGRGMQKIWHCRGQVGNGGLLRSKSTRHRDSGCGSRPPELKNCWPGENACGSESCKARQSCIRALQYVASLIMSFGNVWKKYLGADRSPSESCRGVQKGRDEFSALQELRSEKARQKANDRRQARLERELIDAEEKKQREEVARLVEERRRQREEKLQIEMESEREATAEREREIRRVKELERRRKDKMKERVEEESNAKVGEQIQCNKAHARCEQRDSDAFVKDANSSKVLRLSSSNRCNQGFKNRISSETQMKADSVKRGWTAKSRPSVALNLQSGPQMNILWNNTQSDCQLLANKVKKVETSISSNKKPINLKHDGNESTSDSVNGKAPQSNAWAKGSEALKLHLISSNSGVAGNIGQKIELNPKDVYSPFNNKAVGTKQVSATSTSPGIQQPIAPPSTDVPSLHQLFSSPTIFRTLDLTANVAGESKQPMQGNINPSFGLEHTFFEATSHVSFQSCTGVSISTGPAGSVHGSLCSLPQITVNVENEAVDHMDASHHSILSKPLKLKQTGKSMDNQCSPVLPCCVSVSEPIISDLKTDLSPTSVPLMPNASKYSSINHDAVSWDSYPVCLDKTEDGGERPQEHIWTMLTPSINALYEPLELTKDKDSDTMELRHLRAAQSIFDTEILLPDSLLLSPQKKGSTIESSESITHAGHPFERQSLWSDVSGFNPFVQIWDDGDNHQKLPPEFVDCITQEIMKDPVITADGHSYERAAIEEWLKLHDTSPKTGEVLPPPPGGLGVDKTLRPNHILRGQIIEYKEKLAKMKQNSMAWNNASKDAEHLLPSTLGVLAFY